MKGRVPRHCRFKCWERGALRAPGRHAHLASAWVGCAPCVPVHDRRGWGVQPQTSPHPARRLGIAERLRYYNLPWGSGVRRARGLGGRGAAPRRDHLCSRLLAVGTFPPLGSPPPRAREAGTFPLARRGLNQPRCAARRRHVTRAGRALRVLTRRLYLRPQAGGRADARGGARKDKRSPVLLAASDSARCPA